MDKFFNADFNTDSEELIEVFDELPFWAAPFGIKLFDNIELKKNIKALDIGFGAGFPLTELAMRLGDTCEVYGIDPWEAAIRRTEKKLKIYQINNVKIIRGTAENIPLPDNSISLIVSNNGINNVSDLDKVLSECSRVINSGGQFVQTMNTEGTMIEFYDIMCKVLSEKGLDKEVDSVRQHIYEKRRPIGEICKKLEENHFEVKNIIEDKFEYKFTDGKTMFNYFPIGFYFLRGWKSLIPQDKVKDIFDEILLCIDYIAGQQGYFKLTIPFVVINCRRKLKQ